MFSSQFTHYLPLWYESDLMSVVVAVTSECEQSPTYSDQEEACKTIVSEGFCLEIPKRS